MKGGFTFAMHGAGAYSGCVHTNTREAFEYWRKRGVNVFEIDVGVDDNYEEGIAFAHLMNRDTDWICKELNPRLVDPDYKINVIFAKSTSGLAIMRLSDIFMYLREDPDLIIMFDFWEGWSYNDCCKLTKFIINEVGEETSLWDRFLIEVYTDDMIQAIRNTAPNANMIFGESSLVNYSVRHIRLSGISFVSFPRYMARKNFTKFQEYVECGFGIFQLSKTNYRWKYWRDKGVNVNIVDARFDNVFQIIKHCILVTRQRINVLRVYVDYYGLRKLLKKIIKKIL